jgi:creatinine amidohydrolase
METRWLYTTSENLPLLREASKETCVIPMGCIEKHGLHLPLGTDIIEASGVAYAGSQLETVTIFPDFIFGDVPCNSPAMPAGSITLPLELEMDLLEVLCEQIARHGYKKILVLNGHGGNSSWLAAFSRKLTTKKRNFVFATYMIGLPAPHTMAEYLLANGTGSIPELTAEDEELLLHYHETDMKIGHACMGETAYMMALCPDAVRLDRLGIESGISLNKTRYLREAGIKIMDGGWDVDYPNAYSGHDPIGCNERIGKAALRMESERFAHAVKVLKEDENLWKWHEERQKGW